MNASSLVSILCSTTASKVANREPTREPSFLIIIQSVGVSCLDACAPTHHSTEDGSHHNRLIKPREDLVTYTESLSGSPCSMQSQENGGASPPALPSVA